MLYWITVTNKSAYVLYEYLSNSHRLNPPVQPESSLRYKIRQPGMPAKGRTPSIELLRAVGTDQFSRGAGCTQSEL